jgi:uncharacterized repeat protein (TIGR03803 family)
LVADSAGNLYGATEVGGTGDCPNGQMPPGCGTVFQLTPPARKGGAWTESVLLNFGNGPDGLFPFGALVLDKTGALYGTTSGGGSFSGSCPSNGCGIVFKLTPPAKKGGRWTEGVIYRFKGGSDGSSPQMSVTFDKSGNLYGTTASGGPSNDGTVFRLKHPSIPGGGAWAETVLDSFTGNLAFGAGPSSLIFDQAGNLYGTTTYELGNDCRIERVLGCGTVFKLAPPSTRGGLWTETILHAFDYTYGAWPIAGVILGNNGVLFGTTDLGGRVTSCMGQPCGTVFEIVP